MNLLVPKNVENNEILVYFIFDKDFKNKKISASKIISKNIFLPNKGSVSLQRNKYCNESCCKIIAKKIQNNRNFVGFVIFRKKDFEKVKLEYKKNDRKDFEAELTASPLDENLLPTKKKNIYSEDKGNPTHAEIKYLNPAVQEDEKPNTAIRSFSRKFYKKCSLIIDKKPEENFYNGDIFQNVI